MYLIADGKVGRKKIEKHIIDNPKFSFGSVSVNSSIIFPFGFTNKPDSITKLTVATSRRFVERKAEGN